MKKTNLLKILLTTSFIYMAINYETIYADTTVTGNIGSGTATGVAGSYDGTWSVQLEDIEFRVTLVDLNGNKVDETNSVDYGYKNTDDKTHQVKDQALNYIKNINIGFNYKYGTNNSDNYSYYKLNLVNQQYYNYSYQYTDFVAEFQEIIKSRTKKFGIADNTSGSYDFLTMFLYHCGFLDKSQGYYDIDDDKWSAKRKDLQKLYLLIEPIYSTTGNYTKRGTSSEFASFLLGTGSIPWGLMGSFTYTLGMGMNTTVGDATSIGFTRIINSASTSFVKSGASNATVLNEWRITSSTEYGHGVGLLRIATIIPDPVEITKNINVKEKYCPTDTTGENNGVVEFSIDNTMNNNNDFENAEKAGYKFKKYNDNIFCYDDVKYDFSNTIKTLNDTEVKLPSIVTIPNGKVTINRHCYIDSTTSEYSVAEPNFIKNFDEYENLEIPLSAYNTKIIMKKINQPEPTPDTSLVKSNSEDTKGIYNIRTEITFGYEENDSKITIKNDNGNKNAYIDLSKITYGYSTDLKKQLTDNLSLKNDIYTFTTHLSSEQENYKCPFNTQTINLDITSQLRFRTISLDNPFPSRDASTRLPGSNWLGDDNYVRAYINHNRGVTGSEVYNKEPIYTVTLTPSDIVKVREYNKNNSYSKINLECVGENKTSCLSTFLRNELKDNISGQCFINKEKIQKDPLKFASNNKDYIVDKITSLNNENTNPFRHLYTTDELKIDFNRDGILTLRDAYIYDNAEKTTTFYTCADKTYENSGYMKGGENNE